MSEWIQTYTGRKFEFFNCKPEDLAIKDIARALSHICRFTGHVKQYYSVAQHSVLVSEQAKNPFLGLMHDASEAFIGDMSRPLKHSLGKTSRYHDADHHITRAMELRWRQLGVVTAEDKDDLKNVDMRMLVTEAYDLLEGGPHPGWQINQQTHPRYEFTITPWHPEEAMQRFLLRFQQLSGEWPW